MDEKPLELAGQVRSRRLTPLGVAGVYLVLSYGWIVGSAYVVFWFTPEETMAWTQVMEVAKGLGFVTVTGGMLYVLMRRMTGKMQAQQAALAAEEQKYRNLFNAMPEPAWVYDTSTLRFLRVNDVAVEKYGWSREEFLGGLTILDIRPARDVEKIKALVATLRPGQWVTGEIHQHSTKLGRLFPVMISSQPIVFEGKAGRFVVASDMTEVVRARRQTRRMNRQLRALNGTLESTVARRTESLQRVVSELQWFGEAVTHDIKAPVGHLKELAAELAVRAQERLTPQEAEMAYRMVGASGRLSNMVDELLENARTEGGERVENVSVAVVVSEVLGQLGREPEARTRTCRVSMVEPLYWARTDRMTLVRVITALMRMGMVNAEGVSGRSVVVEAEEVDRDGEAGGPGGEREARLRVMFECDSVMVAELAERVATTNGTGGAGQETGRGNGEGGYLGTRVGMAVVLRSVARMRGRVTVEERGDGRSVVVLELPAADEGV